jgi:hypothetical protein
MNTMEYTLHNASNLSSKTVRIDAHIAKLPQILTLLAASAFLFSPAGLDYRILFDIWAAALRDENALLSTGFAVLAHAVAFVSMIALLVPLHLVLDRVPRRYWTWIWVAVAALGTLALLSQQILLEFQETAAARVPLDAAPGAPLNDSLWYAETQAVLRVPIFVAALATAAWAITLFKLACRRLSFVNRLKAVRRRTHDLTSRHVRATVEFARQEMNDQARRMNVTEEAVAEVCRLATNESDTIIAYVRGLPLGAAFDAHLATALAPAPTAVPDEVRDLARRFAPNPLNLRQLPANAADLSAEARAALTAYATWIREHFQHLRIMKEII